MSLNQKSSRTKISDKGKKSLFDNLSSNKKLDDITNLIKSSNTNESEINSLKVEVQGKQDVLVSGQSIKTINGQSILGSGNIVITSGGGSNYERRSDYVYPYQYSGTASLGTIDSGTWTIKRVDFTTSGSPITLQATGAWTNRYTLTYV